MQTWEHDDTIASLEREHYISRQGDIEVGTRSKGVEVRKK